MTENKRTRQPNGRSSIYLGKDGKWHGRVTVGVRDDGSPDRRHVERKTRAEVTTAVRKLEKEREAKAVRKPGKAMTVKAWLTHWIENVAPLGVNDNTMVGYGVAVRKHLIPGLGAHRLDRLTPEHIEIFYAKMQANGSKPATAHQVHRTFRTALNEAVRRGHLGKNPVQLAKAPKTGDYEAEPYTVKEVQRLLEASGRQRNSARWAVALALGLRQGEVLALKWDDVDLEGGFLVVRRSRHRPQYAHGCSAPAAGRPGTARRSGAATRRPPSPSRVPVAARSVSRNSSLTYCEPTARPRTRSDRQLGSAG